MIDHALITWISCKVKFLGVRGDIPSLCKAMDAFVMPSLFEGLPVVGIEAQAAGLPCLFSTDVTDEVVILPESDRISLKESNEEWADRILKLQNCGIDRKEAIKPIQKAGYDINTETEKITKMYLNWAIK